MGTLTNNWDEFIEWARQFRAWSDFDDQLRRYKLKFVAPALRVAREAVRRDQGNWPSLLREACQLSNRDRPHKDLPDSGYYSPFVRWCETDPSQARPVLLALWDEQRDVVGRVREFMEAMKVVQEQSPVPVVHNNMHGMQASFLLLGEDPYKLPMYRDTSFDLAYELICGSKRDRSGPHDSGEVYRRALSFLDQFIGEASARGLELRDRLDAQSLVWCVTKWPLDLSNSEAVAGMEREKRELLQTYRISGSNRKGESQEVTAIRSVVAEHMGDASTPPSTGHKQGYLPSAKARRELERRAMQRATKWYEAQGWEVQDDSRFYSYDLLCKRNDCPDLRVEVKGTTSDGHEVLLTPNEVRMARKWFPNTALVVVAGLKLDGNDGTGYLVSGGKLSCFQPWQPDDESLEPLGFVYTVPSKPSQ